MLSFCDFNTNPCIGWDRTPLFVSLLRLTLWADGEAHQTLTADEVENRLREQELLA